MMFKPALNLVDFSKQKLASIAIIFFTFGFADYESSIRQSAKFRDLRSFCKGLNVRFRCWEEAKVPFKITPDTWLRCRYISEKFLQNWIPSKFTITFFTFRKNLNLHHNRTLNTPFTGFGFC